MKAMFASLFLSAAVAWSCSNQTKSRLRDTVDCSVTGTCKKERLFRGDGGGVCTMSLKRPDGSRHTTCYEFAWERTELSDPTQEIQAGIKAQCDHPDPDIQSTFISGGHCPAEYARCISTTNVWGVGVVVTQATHDDPSSALTATPPTCPDVPPTGLMPNAG